jgi:hypothetical protein
MLQIVSQNAYFCIHKMLLYVYMFLLWLPGGAEMASKVIIYGKQG